MTASIAKEHPGNASASACIPIAGFKDVYDVSDVEKALQELAPGTSDALRAVYEKMLRVGGQRFTVKPSTMPPIVITSYSIHYTKLYERAYRPPELSKIITYM